MVGPKNKDSRRNAFAAADRPGTTGRIHGVPAPSSLPLGPPHPRSSRTASPTPMTSAAPDLPPAGAVGPPLENQAFEAQLVRAARRAWPDLPAADAAAAVDAGMLAEASGAVGQPGQSVAAAVGAAAAMAQRQGVPGHTHQETNWSSFGQVIPVLAGSPGSGASVLAAAIADALQLSGRSVLLVDAADPVRSGLAMAARNAGPWVRGPHPAVCIRYSWRARALLAQLETWLPVVAPGMVPPPRFWHPGTSVQATVVDLGHDSWRLAAHPLTGAGEWLRRGTPLPVPILVVRPSRPSLMHAEQVLSRLEPWVGTGAATAPAQLVVMGAKRWPAGVVGSAGRRLAALLPGAVFVPHHAATAANGVSAQVTASQLLAAVAPMLRRWGERDTEGARR